MRKKIKEIQQWLREDYFSGRMLFHKVALLITTIMSIVSLTISITQMCSP